MKGGTSIPFTSEITYLGNRDMKNYMLQKWCSAQSRGVLAASPSYLSCFFLASFCRPLLVINYFFLSILYTLAKEAGLKWHLKGRVPLR